jgi:dipeptidyl aminopeptidase/acylaminoacyl peptidase
MRYLLLVFFLVQAFSSNAQKLLSKKPLDIKGAPHSLIFSSITYLSDGLKINGFIVEPKEGHHLPVIIFNRGGNGDFAKITDATLVQWVAPIAREGYIVIASQYRGGSGSEGKNELGGRDVNDIMNLFPIIRQIPNADTSRIGMYGWSRGGIMSYLVLAKTCKIKTAVIGGAPTDLNLENQRRPGMEKVCADLIPGYAANRTMELQKRSAIYWPEKLCPSTSILLLHGKNDWRVHYTESENMARKLNTLHRKYELHLFDGDDHILNEHQKEKDSLILHWFGENL